MVNKFDKYMYHIHLLVLSSVSITDHNKCIQYCFKSLFINNDAKTKCHYLKKFSGHNILCLNPNPMHKMDMTKRAIDILL